MLDVSDDGGAEREEAKARIRTAEAALARLEELLEEGTVHPKTAERLRGSLGFRRDRFRPGSTTATTARSRSARPPTSA